MGSGPVPAEVVAMADEEDQHGRAAEWIARACGRKIRLGVELTDSAGAAQTGAPISLLEGLTAGTTRHYQFWYRDPAGPCGQGFNTSNAYRVAW